MNRKLFLIVAACAMMAVLSSCSSNAAVTVAYSTPPPANVEINTTATMAAVVTNAHNPMLQGVEWTCSPTPCGSFNPAMTASGATTTWTAPSLAGSVTITAESVEGSDTVNANVNVTPVAAASDVVGNYTFYVSGWDASGSFYGAAGVVVLDGNGNVTRGEEDLNNTSTGASTGDTLAGTYTVNSDGQGTMILTATSTATSMPDPNVGVGGAQTLSFVVVNNSHLLIDEFDAAATSSGSMDLQTPAAITSGISGNYAFAFGGFVGGVADAQGGVISASGASITGTGDENAGGSVSFANALSANLVGPDPNGRGQFTTLGGSVYTYYIVGTEAFYAVEVDSGGVTIGTGYGQSSGTFSAASLTSGYVLDEPQPYAEAVAGSLALAGQFNADGVGTSATSITGVTDYNEWGFVDPGPGPDTLTASYTIASNGYGSMSTVVSNDIDFATYGIYVTDPALNINDPNNTSGGGGALIVELDPNDVGIGFIVPQTATALTSVNNGNQFNAFNTNGDQIASTGQVVFSTGGFAGTENVNDLNVSMTPSQTETPAATVTGITTADSTNVGRYTVAVTVNGAATPSSQVSYVANGNLAVDVDVDSTSSPVYWQVGSGITEGQP